MTAARLSQAEMELWPGMADRCRLEVDDAVHAAALSGLKDQRARDGHEARPAVGLRSGLGEASPVDTVYAPADPAR